MKKTLKRLLFGDTPGVITIKAGIAAGLKFEIDPKHNTQKILGLDEREIHSCFRKYSKECPYFFDIGASNGYYSVIYKKFNPQGTAFLFDAASRFEAEQKKHFKINRLDTNIHYYTQYVADKTTETSICIDDIFSQQNQNVFIKIDVDGGEAIVLNGLRNVLKKNNCKLIVEVHSPALEKECHQIMQDFGYRTGIIYNAWWRAFLPELRPLELNRWFWAEK